MWPFRSRSHWCGKWVCSQMLFNAKKNFLSHTTWFYAKKSTFLDKKTLFNNKLKEWAMCSGCGSNYLYLLEHWKINPKCPRLSPNFWIDCVFATSRTCGNFGAGHKHNTLIIWVAAIKQKCVARIVPKQTIVWSRVRPRCRPPAPPPSPRPSVFVHGSFAFGFRGWWKSYVFMPL